MMTGKSLKQAISSSMYASMLLCVLGISLFAQGNNPVIIVPGLSGSELKHKETGERLWFRALRSKSEDLRLPISENISANHDLLVPGDLLRTVRVSIFPVADVYGGLIESMITKGGYHEESWDTPSSRGAADAVYVFPYDWRLDNVENARRLIKKIEALKVKLNKPDLKFDVVAHSMGGIISRYAAMYGDADLGSGTVKSRPSWAGATHFEKIILMGTPNEGSAQALNTLLNGFMIGKIRVDFPFLQDSSKFTIFTIPSAYQLLPAPGTLKAYNDRLEPVEIDIYDPKTWTKYGWNVINDRAFATEFSRTEQRTADKYFAAVLDRAKRLHEALAAPTAQPAGLSFYILGSECRTSLDSIVLYRDETADRWRTLFRPKGFRRSDGERITDDELKKVMMTEGDGVVTRRSLESTTQSGGMGRPRNLNDEPSKFICEEHTKLPTNSMVQDHIVAVLAKKSVNSSSTLTAGK